VPCGLCADWRPGFSSGLSDFDAAEYRQPKVPRITLARSARAELVMARTGIFDLLYERNRPIG